MLLNNLKKLLHKLHQDEKGDIPVGPLLIIALIVVPLVLLLVVFKEKVIAAFQTETGKLNLDGGSGGGPGGGSGGGPGG